MTITTNEVPTQGGTIQDALAQAQKERAEQTEPEIAAEPDEQPDKVQAVTDQVKKDKERVRHQVAYAVFEVVEKDDQLDVTWLGEFHALHQGAARRLAVLEDEQIKARVMAGEDVVLAAVAKFTPVKVEVENRDPVIKA